MTQVAIAVEPQMLRKLKAPVFVDNKGNRMLVQGLWTDGTPKTSTVPQILAACISLAANKLPREPDFIEIPVRQDGEGADIPHFLTGIRLHHLPEGALVPVMLIGGPEFDRATELAKEKKDGEPEDGADRGSEPSDGPGDAPREDNEGPTVFHG